MRMTSFITNWLDWVKLNLDSDPLVQNILRCSSWVTFTQLEHLMIKLKWSTFKLQFDYQTKSWLIWAVLFCYRLREVSRTNPRGESHNYFWGYADIPVYWYTSVLVYTGIPVYCILHTCILVYLYTGISVPLGKMRTLFAFAFAWRERANTVTLVYWMHLRLQEYSWSPKSILRASREFFRSQFWLKLQNVFLWVGRCHTCSNIVASTCRAWQSKPSMRNSAVYTTLLLTTCG